MLLFCRRKRGLRLVHCGLPLLAGFSRSGLFPFAFLSRLARSFSNAATARRAASSYVFFGRFLLLLGRFDFARFKVE
jgi:hypothetical protein